MRFIGANTALLTSASLIGQAFTAVTYWATARVLLPADFGVVVAAASVAILILGTLDFGVNAATIRRLARHPNDHEAFSQTFSAKLLVSGLVGSLWVLLLGIVSIRNPFVLFIMPLGLYILFADITSSVNVLPRSMGKMRNVAITQITDKGVSLIVTVLLLVVAQLGRWSLPFGLAAGAAASCLTAFLLNQPRADLRFPSGKLLFSLWRSSASFGLSALALQMQRLDVSIVATVAGPAASGIYAAPARLINVFSVLPQSLSHVLFPRLSSGATEGKREALKMIGLSSGLTAVVAAGVFVFAEPIVRIALGPAYAASVSVLRVFLVATIFGSVIGPLAAILQATGKEGFVAKSMGLISLVGLTGIVIGSFVADHTGAAFGFLLMQVLMGSLLAIVVLGGARTESPREAHSRE